MTLMAAERWEQVKELYNAALAREPELRSAFLAEACAKDAALLSEVESLLRSNKEAGSFLVATALKASADGQPELGVEQRIGSYQLVCEIGHGGMGTVYLADRADAQYRKRVAIKLIKRGMDSESILRRFKNERQILASLDHPNIARLLDAGTTEDGLPYFVMEYVDGETLFRHCDTHKLSIVERLKLFRTICSAVHYAHRSLVVHRDLKPKNVLVTADGVPKLLDFGIAKFLKPELSLQTIELTSPAVRLMTPEYASPEQFRGETPTPASDIYSLGVLLYELLTGHRPYRFGGRSPDEMARVVCEEQPEKPSDIIGRVEELPSSDGTDPIALTPESVSRTRDASPEQLRRQLRGDLDKIVSKALQKEPRRRYASVEQLSEDIHLHLESRPIVARSDWLPYRVGKTVRRHRTGAIATGLILLAFAGVGATVWYGHPRPPTVADNTLKSLAVMPFVNSTADPNADYLFDGITESIINVLSQLPQLRVVARSTSFRFKNLEVDPQKVGRELGVDVVLTGTAAERHGAVAIQVELVKVSDGTQLWGDHYQRPMTEVFAMQEEIAKAIAQKLRFKLTDEQQRRVGKRYTENQEAYNAYLKGRYFWNQRTEEGINKAIEYFQKAIEIDPAYALAYAGMASCYAVLPSYHPVASEVGYAQGKVAAHRALEMDPTLSEAWTALAWIKFFYDWDLPAAETEFAHALELNPSGATTHQWHSLYLSALGRFDEAVSEMRVALTLDPLSTIINNNLARVLYFARRYPQAIDQFQKTLELDADFYPAHYELGSAYLQSGMYQQAIAEWRVDTGPRGIARRAYAAALSGDKGAALAAVDSLKKLSDQRDIPALIALLYIGLGNQQQALDWLEKAYQGRDDWLIFLKVEPEFDPLRRHPRFGDLLRRLKLDR